MIGQLIVAFATACFNRIVNTFKLLGNAKFYFTAFLIALVSISLIFKDTIEVGVKGKLFSSADFREARNPYALQSALDEVVKKDTNILYYDVFLYEPKNKSFYKKLIVTNSEVVKNSPALQVRYLKDQPSINAGLDVGGYYLIDDIELRKPDLKLLKDLGVVSALYYRLSSNGTSVGEIVLRFKEKPSAQELDNLLKKLSPFLYTYII